MSIDEMLLSMAETKAMKERWCLDSGATSHMSGRKEWFSELVSFNPKLPIRVGNGKIIYAIAKGYVNVRVFDGTTWADKHLDNVLYLPDLKYNLFSLSSTLDKGFTMATNSISCRINKNGRTVAVGERVKQLYLMNFKVAAPRTKFACVGESINKGINKLSLKYWHERHTGKQ